MKDLSKYDDINKYYVFKLPFMDTVEVIHAPKNLNKDSTHPKPWRPPTMVDFRRGNYEPYRIAEVPEKFTPIRNHLKEDPFWYKMGLFTYRGFLIGSGIALSEMVLVSRPQGFKASLSRYLYLMPPFPCAAASYIATREVLDHVYGDKPFIYFWSMLLPASIWGVYYNDAARGVMAMVLGGLLSYFYKVNADTGGMIYLGRDMFNEVDRHKHVDTELSTGTKYVPFLWKYYKKNGVVEDTEPSWKKWVEAEKKNMGPIPKGI